MKKATFSLLLAVLLTLVMVTTAFAEDNTPVGDCPDGFSLQMAMNHDNHGDHMHQHVGTDADQNGDGFVCMKPISLDGKIHVHIDNDLPLI